MKKQPLIEPMNPGVRLLTKLASVVVHCEEAMSATGHQFDVVAIDSLVSDQEVRDWIKAMGTMGLLPLKR